MKKEVVNKKAQSNSNSNPQKKTGINSVVNAKKKADTRGKDVKSVKRRKSTNPEDILTVYTRNEKKKKFHASIDTAMLFIIIVGLMLISIIKLEEYKKYGTLRHHNKGFNLIHTVEDGEFPEDVMKWYPIVKDRLAANDDPNDDIDLTKFQNAILTTIYQESAGRADITNGDIMQAAESSYMNDCPDSWTTEQKSVDAGVKTFHRSLQLWGVTDPFDYDGLQMVAQGYNYGPGFLKWAKEKGYTKWSKEVSAEFSYEMANQLGWSSYGHIEYGQEWLDKLEKCTN